MNKTKIEWAYACKNAVIMVCWTVLAITFGKWWIALFSFLAID